MSKNEYLHGYTQEEQDRLDQQAQLLEPYVYQGVDLSKVKNLLEVGCGTGAQTEILLKRFSHIESLVGFDISEEQLKAASKRLSSSLNTGRVELHQSDARDLSLLGERKFDGAFLCWFLEHVPEPLTVLEEIKKYLLPNSPIILSEVNNSSFFVDPYSPAILKYWFEFNDHQWSIQGHPYVGVQLGSLLHQAKFKNISLESRSFHFDIRQPDQREIFLTYFRDLLLSASPSLIKSGRIDSQLVDQVKDEFNILLKEKYSVILYSWIRATAIS